MGKSLRAKIAGLDLFRQPRDNRNTRLRIEPKASDLTKPEVTC